MAFLRRFLTPELMRELDLFTWKTARRALVVDEVADEEHWESVKPALLRQIGSGSFPDHPHRTTPTSAAGAASTSSTSMTAATST